SLSLPLIEETSRRFKHPVLKTGPKAVSMKVPGRLSMPPHPTPRDDHDAREKCGLARHVTR
ncbi:MAG: hypothetical protein WA579_09085, partial [Rhodomicrobium sp.]